MKKATAPVVVPSAKTLLDDYFGLILNHHYKIGQAAELIGISPRQLGYWTDCEMIDCIRDGKNREYTGSEMIKAYMVAMSLGSGTFSIRKAQIACNYHKFFFNSGPDPQITSSIFCRHSASSIQTLFTNVLIEQFRPTAGLIEEIELVTARKIKYWIELDLVEAKEECTEKGYVCYRFDFPNMFQAYVMDQCFESGKPKQAAQKAKPIVAEAMSILANRRKQSRIEIENEELESMPKPVDYSAFGEKLNSCIIKIKTVEPETFEAFLAQAYVISCFTQSHEIVTTFLTESDLIVKTMNLVALLKHSSKNIDQYQIFAGIANLEVVSSAYLLANLINFGGVDNLVNLQNMTKFVKTGCQKLNESHLINKYGPRYRVSIDLSCKIQRCRQTSKSEELVENLIRLINAEILNHK